MMAVVVYMAVPTQAQPVRVTNVDFYQEGATVFVLYDLEGKAEDRFGVDLALSIDGGRTFPIEPHAVIGDVGTQVRAGARKRIAWSFVQDFPEGLEGDLVFEVRVTRQRRGRKLLHTLVGTLVVGGGAAAAAILLFGDSGKSGALAMPPPRPGN